MGDRWVLGNQGLRWSHGVRPALRPVQSAPACGSAVLGPYDSVRASTNDIQTMTMLGLGARWVLARHGLAGTRRTFQPAVCGLTCTNGTGGVQRDQ